jgi:4-hydroxythreonine-4-phosphate dehydrogenase
MSLRSRGRPRPAAAFSGGGVPRGGRPRIAVTIGDPAGVGPDVALGAAAVPEIAGSFDLCLVGSRSAMEARAALLSTPMTLEFVDVGDAPADPGRPTEAGARVAVESIVAAARMCQTGEADAMVTGPVSKAAVAAAGYEFSGHTEFLAALTGAPTVVMTFVSGQRRVALATTHHALNDVAGILSTELIVSRLLILSDGLRDWLDVAEPRIAVAALNPHAGEDGRLGLEERLVIMPAVARARDAGVLVDGPFPGDAIFQGLGEPGGRGLGAGFDAVLAMYHDQGTIPAKLWGGGTVNLTLGLPIVRTSVDHGTAFGMAGSGAADHGSMAAAIRLAGEIALRRSGVSP